MKSGSISRYEWIAALAIALLVTALLQLPYALGYALAQPGTEYTGLLINVEDGSYLSAIGQGIEGAWLYLIPFTTEAHAPAFIQVFYLALGHAARALNLSATAMWHLARVIADLVLFIVLYGFIARFLESPSQRRVAYALAIFSAGYAFWRFPFDPPTVWEALPMELRVPEAHIFYSALTYPHFALGIALMLATFWLLLRVLNEEPTRAQILAAFGAGIGNLLIGIVFPFLMYLMIAVTGAYFVFLMWQRRRILWRALVGLGIVFAIPAPLFAYYQLVLMTNPVFQHWNAQATTLSPHPIHFGLTYLPLLICAALAWRSSTRVDESRRRLFAFLWIWISVVAILLYVPITQQRRFVEGVQVPLAILAALGLCEVALPRLARTRVFIALSQRPNYSAAGLQRLVIVGIIALASLASFYLWLSSVVLLGVVQPYPLFRPTAELQAMDWLPANTAPSDAILSSYWSGSFIPARAGKRVFVGQRYETIRFDEKRAAAERFFDAATDDASRVALLREYRVAYVFWGQAERELGAFDPERAAYLQRVFANDQARVYRVRLP
ncbi:MAG: hypothetical protein FJ009_14515 [Chloroflexi bacterium]|nr:hypothetical protein [Chloroflexota bacterium]